MSNLIRARVKGDVIEPLQIDLLEGQEVMVTILAPTDREAFQRSAGQWKGTLYPEALIRNIDDDRLVSTRPVPSL
ncbi:MAG: hypothetical protein P0120_24260 [Nitrospira sp.]|nr:hypothetical protein [Nitrospira sp.]